MVPGGLSGLDGNAVSQLVDGLVEQGWFAGERFIDTTLCRSLHDELQRLSANQALSEAGIGRGDQHRLRRDIRGDAIHWLDRESQAQRHYLALMAELQQQINRALYLGLFEFEAHFAEYPPGAFYKRHVDSFQGRANRVISTVLYLNPDWPDDGGGEMAVYAEDDETREVARVRPEAGTFMCFLSDRIPHAVLPTRYPRASIAGWFRRNASLGGRIDPAR
ncbi:2OG-Fe(II) oxygenase [Halomonas sp. McH1-25]|uniref:2OG-Fe(II) oxygenase n=1 Tax=unclassified Halomonas TaxID=2609666 RepID=UPI001EF74E1D|nr:MULTISPECIES: 2OG-Fe(II) oxygenase [unclassified Halomonas]MCG7600509.1 2OG-Fe(II) oxygenase [Halomonas sp. McH1-25]MCP1343569.1 2OG-Fe(II) oxygenase [Halomonas sp. FL8]MCP1360016.1 2OG-Fe(II) oxygenase [Halomonas sp. BBD45]MCP1364907.1 2OG-Fe(II) oxygenase [Halomonas sp. BBD48]